MTTHHHPHPLEQRHATSDRWRTGNHPGLPRWHGINYRISTFLSLNFCELHSCCISFRVHPCNQHTHFQPLIATRGKANKRQFNTQHGRTSALAAKAVTRVPAISGAFV